MPPNRDESAARRSTAPPASANLGGRFGSQVARAPAGIMKRYPHDSVGRGRFFWVERTRGAQSDVDPAEALSPHQVDGE